MMRRAAGPDVAPLSPRPSRSSPPRWSLRPSRRRPRWSRSSTPCSPSGTSTAATDPSPSRGRRAKAPKLEVSATGSLAARPRASSTARLPDGVVGQRCSRLRVRRLRRLKRRRPILQPSVGWCTRVCASDRPLGVPCAERGRGPNTGPTAVRAGTGARPNKTSDGLDGTASKGTHRPWKIGGRVVGIAEESSLSRYANGATVGVPRVPVACTEAGGLHRRGSRPWRSTCSRPASPVKRFRG
jgi:hypothetical protein